MALVQALLISHPSLSLISPGGGGISSGIANLSPISILDITWGGVALVQALLISHPSLSLISPGGGGGISSGIANLSPISILDITWGGGWH